MLTIGGSAVEEEDYGASRPGSAPKRSLVLGSMRSDGGTNLASSEWMRGGNGTLDTLGIKHRFGGARLRNESQ